MRKTKAASLVTLPLLVLAAITWRGEASNIVKSAYATIQNAGSPLTQRQTLNFTGSVSCSDTGSITECNVTGGGGGGGTQANLTFSFSGATTVVMTHNLGTTAVLVQCKDNSSPPVLLEFDQLEYTSTNAVTATFAEAATGSCTLNASMGEWQLYQAVVTDAGSCASMNKCWFVNGVEVADLEADMSQDLTVFTLPANGYVEGARIKTSTAFTGATTATATLGTADDATFYLTSPYDLAAAVSDTNFAPADGQADALGSTTAASVAFVAQIVTTVENVDDLDAGSAFDLWVKWTSLP